MELGNSQIDEEVEYISLTSTFHFLRLVHISVRLWDSRHEGLLSHNLTAMGRILRRFTYFRSEYIFYFFCGFMSYTLN